MIIRIASTTSTMEEAIGHPPGTVIVAEEQTSGQGRLGRRWHSEKGAGLYFSTVLGLPEPSPLITLALGLAAQEAIQQVAGIGCDLRWPNDVLIGERKCAGILVNHHGATVIAGIGVNVNHAAFPVDVADTATSLRIATGCEHDKEALLARLLDAISTFTGLLSEQGTEVVLRLFTEASSYVRGRRVVVDGVEGTTDGMNPSGFLWLRDDHGGRRLIVAGGVRPR